MSALTSAFGMLPDFKILLNRFPPAAVALTHAAKRKRFTVRPSTLKHENQESHHRFVAVRTGRTISDEMTAHQ
jgi:hypothetical protein